MNRIGFRGRILFFKRFKSLSRTFYKTLLQYLYSRLINGKTLNPTENFMSQFYPLILGLVMAAPRLLDKYFRSQILSCLTCKTKKFDLNELREW